jgi:hypothetical protein
MAALHKLKKWVELSRRQNPTLMQALGTSASWRPAGLSFCFSD